MSDLNEEPPEQESLYRQVLDSCQLVALLRLNSFGKDSTTTTGDASNHPLYNPSGSNSMKRRSPSSLPDTTAADTFCEPKPKKLFVEQDDSDDLHGFSKISLPTLLLGGAHTQTQSQSYPVLRRCVSDHLTNSQLPEPPRKMGVIPETPSPNKWGSSSALPPLPSSLRRTVVPGPTSTPMKTITTRGSCVAMCADLVEEKNPNSKSVSETEADDPEESVKVERVGECLTLHFKCPCGKGYQILLSGNNCYYKLM